MNQLIDQQALYEKLDRQQQADLYLDYSRTAQTDSERRFWARAERNTRQGVNTFPNELEPVYAKMYEMYEEEKSQVKVAEKLELSRDLVQRVLSRKRITETAIETLKQIEL